MADKKKDQYSLFKDFLENDLVSVTGLNIICLKLFGTEYYNWEPETVELELKEITNDVTDLNLDKIQAISTLLTTNLFYLYFEVFESISNVLNLDMPMFDTLTPLDSFQVTWAILEARLNDDEKHSYSSEVENYVKQVFIKDGATRTPPILKKIILPDYDIMAELDKDQRKEQEDFERELNQFVTRRFNLIQKEIRELDDLKK